MRLVLMAAALGSAVTASAHALQSGYDPTYGQTTLEAGFTPNPVTVNLTAGGVIDAAAEIGGDCTGQIAIAPDYLVAYSGDGSALTIAADSPFDTVLAVQGPDGVWHCDDDGAGGNDPQIVFEGAAHGEYAIRVGSKDGDARAVLTVEETR